MVRLAILVACICPAIALVSSAATVSIKAGMAGKWHLASSYEGDELPGSGDTISVDAGVQATANDADCEFIRDQGIAGLQIRGDSSHEKGSLTVTINNEETVLPCKIWAGPTKYANEAQYTLGLVKEGPGRLRIGPSPRENYDLNCNYVVNHGVLQFPVEATKILRHFKRLTINSPGVAWMSIAENGEGQSMCFNEGLCGDGVFSNTVTATHAIRVGNQDKFSDVPMFTGRITGNTSLNSLAGKTIMAGTCESTNTVALNGSAKMYMTVIGGGTGENVINGSTGSGNFSVDATSASLRGIVTLGYLGTGQTSYATVTGGSGIHSFTIDGGPNGGLLFTGGISFTSATNTNVRLVLDGENENECVLSSKVVGSTKAGRAVRLVKRGSGTWRVVEASGSTIKGVVAVEEGVLKADTVARSGKNCSLGYSTLLQEDYDGLYDDSRLVPYSILLGSPSSRGTLEYSGTDALQMTTRPIALAGEGGLKSDTAAISWYDVTAADAGPKTLVLDGAAEGSTMFNVQDGPGTVSVVKEGSGSWTLGGTLDFTGGIDVREGDLSITCATNCYTWYKFLMMESYSGGKRLELGRFSLFNSSGIVQNGNLATNGAALADISLLQPGEAVRSGGTDFDGVHKLFLTTNSTSFVTIQPSTAPSLDNEQSWVGCVFRLRAGADPVESYDIGHRWSNDSGYVDRTPQSWKVFGSVDGINWHELSEVVSNRTWLSGSPGTCSWARKETKFFQDAQKKWDPEGHNTSGWPIASGIFPESTLDDGIDNLSVAKDATLASDKTITTRRITVDASGMGSASGFALAEGGVIDIVNAPITGDFAVDVDFTGIDLPSGYSILVDGEQTSKRIAISQDGRKIFVFPVGFIMTLR